MQWTSTQVAQLFELTESGQLTGQQLDAAARIAPLEPSRRDWVTALDRILGFGGVLLIGAAVIFFFAYNWDELHRLTKIGLALAVLATTTGAAMIAPPFGVAYRAALFGACVASGALLALIGQTYQTGADMWMLFAGWAALMTPFAALSRSSASWALWLIVLNAALLRALSQSVWFPVFGMLSHAASLLAVAGLNLAVLVLLECGLARMLIAPARHLHRLAAIGVFVPLIGGAIVGWWDRGLAGVTLAFYCAALAATLVYLRLRRDLPILALALYGTIAVTAAAFVVKVQVESFVALNLVGLLVIAASGGAGVWLSRLHRESGAQ